MRKIAECLSRWSLKDGADAVGCLDLSAAAEADRDLAVFYDHRDLAATIRILQHTPETLLVLQNVDVLERDLASGEILTGSRSVGSQILTENKRWCRHTGFPTRRLAIS